MLTNVVNKRKYIDIISLEYSTIYSVFFLLILELDAKAIVLFSVEDILIPP